MLSVSEESCYTEEMELLRRVGNPPQMPRTDAADVFESRSIHVCYRVDGTLAAMIRMTAGPNSVFEAWTQGLAAIPTGPSIVDLNRAVVAPPFRRLGLFRLATVDSLIRSAAKGFVSAVGVTRPGREIIPAMLEIGFEPAGPEVMVTDPVNGRFPIQPYVVWNLSQHEARLGLQFEQLRARLADSGHRVGWSWADRREHK